MSIDPIRSRITIPHTIESQLSTSQPPWHLTTRPATGSSRAAPGARAWRSARERPGND